MDTIIKDFVSTEKKRWRRAIQKSMRTVANKVKIDFVIQAKRCMDNYYEEYDPLEHGGYVRTYNLQNHAVYPYEVTRKGEVDVGAAFSPKDMDPYPTSTNSKLNGDEISNLVVNNFMEGIHGNPDIYKGAKVNEMMHDFTTLYRANKLDKYFSDINFTKYMN